MKNIEFATFGGGCFWGVEKFLQDISGVVDAVSGYAGGDFIDPTYSDVCGGRTGHAEVVNVEFDASIVTFEELTKEFLSKYGTTSTSNLNSTSQYRSIIFFRNDLQKDIIDKIYRETKNNNSKQITTQVIALEKFYEAEERHQDYYGSCRTDNEY